MREIINNLNEFISEQKQYFIDNIRPSYSSDWEDAIWYGGAKTTGWLNTTTAKVSFNFENTNRLVGFNSLNISANYAEFCKAMLVCSFRLKNGCSPQALQAELITLKRWYCILFEETGQDHPYLLSTEIIEKAMRIVEKHSAPGNVSDLCGNSVRLQNIINKKVLTLLTLNYVNIHKNQNAFNANKKVRIAQEAKKAQVLDTESRDKSKLISVKTFLNIIALLDKSLDRSEKVLLYATMLLIITGFRSAELIMLRIDSLVRREVIDPVTKKTIQNDGQPIYYLGIKYHGVKGAGMRTHWVEPLAAPLVETIFREVINLTSEFRNHIAYLRDKKFTSFLPKSFERFEGDNILIDDFYPYLISFECQIRNEAQARDKAVKVFSNRALRPAFEERIDTKRIKKFYRKSDINAFLKSICPHDSYTIEMNYEGTIHKWVLEDMLFITPIGASSYSRTLTQLTTFDILNTTMLNNWLGGSSAENKSVFQHYDLKDDNGEYSALTSHMPRHNINTFLALTGLSEILQAMLMGRVDVTQNQHYQHLAVLELKKAVKTQLASIESADTKASPALSPVEICAQDGQMLFSNALDLEKNLKRNLHTFDGQEDVTEFLSDVINSDDPFGDEFLSDFKDSLAAKGSKTVLQTKEALETHAYLFPVLNGACMRDVRKDGCPSRLKCVAGAGCCNFVVTGRQGELDNLISLRNTLEISVKKAEALAQNDARYQRAFIEQRQNLTNIQMAVEKTYRARQQLVPVRVFPDAPNLSNFGGAKPTLSLVDLFASEQVKLEMVKVRKTQDAE